MPGRRTPRPRSWLDRIRDASAAAVGIASGIADAGDGDASPRTPAYPVEAGFEVQDVLFGEPPGDTSLSGTATVPAGEREETGFPPDLLHETPFWDEAEPGTSAPAFVLWSDGPPIVRRLADGDPLPADVRDVRRWIEDGASVDDVVKDLGARPAGPVAFAAGFQLLVSGGADPAETFAAFRNVPRSTPGALAGVIESLRSDAPDDLDTVAEALAAGWEAEQDPATVVAYITWFDALGDQVPAERETVARLAERDESASFDGPWNDEVHRRAAALR